MEYRNGPSKGTAGIRGKDDDRKLFVGGLPKNCGEKDVRDTFSKYGAIESVNINMDPITGQSRGFCFIVFNDACVVDNVLKSGDIFISGKKVDPRKVIKSPGKVFIGGLTSEFTEEKIREFFGQHGKITGIEWPFDRQKNQNKAFCFISFESRETVDALLKTPKMVVYGKELDIKKVKFNPEAMWQQGYNASPYAARGGRGGPQVPYPSYGYDTYGEDSYETGYYLCQDDRFQPEYSPGYGSRPQRGGRGAGYARHSPY